MCTLNTWRSPKGPTNGVPNITIHKRFIASIDIKVENRGKQNNQRAASIQHKSPTNNHDRIQHKATNPANSSNIPGLHNQHQIWRMDESSKSSIIQNPCLVKKPCQIKTLWENFEQGKRVQGKTALENQIMHINEEQFLKTLITLHSNQ